MQFDALGNIIYQTPLDIGGSLPRYVISGGYIFVERFQGNYSQIDVYDAASGDAVCETPTVFVNWDDGSSQYRQITNFDSIDVP
jgi:hypothetical protein